MYRPIANSLDAIDVHVLTEAAQSLGAGWWKTMIRVIVPNIMPGIISGCLLVFSTVFAEFTLANLLVGTRFKTFPIYLVEFTRFDGRQASALAVISFVIAWLTSLLILWIAGRGGRPAESLGARSRFVGSRKGGDGKRKSLTKSLAIDDAEISISVKLTRFKEEK
jgi:putative spermidine/putrescine transport system permease protein